MGGQWRLPNAPSVKYLHSNPFWKLPLPPGCLSWELTVQAWEFGGLSLPPSGYLIMGVVVSLQMLLATARQESGVAN